MYLDQWTPPNHGRLFNFIILLLSQRYSSKEQRTTPWKFHTRRLRTTTHSSCCSTRANDAQGPQTTIGCELMNRRELQSRVRSFALVCVQAVTCTAHNSHSRAQ